MEVVLVNEDLDSRNHKYTRDISGIKMDGKKVYGIDEIPGGKKKYIIYKKYLKIFNVIWDGERVPIKNNDFPHLFNVGLKWADTSDERPTSIGSLLCMSSINNDALLFSLKGGDGAGTFTLWCMVNRRGILGVFIEGPN